MKKIKTIQISLILLALIAFTACVAKKITEKEQASISKYDPAAFDYLYGEGLRHKFMGNSGEALMYFEQSRRLNPENDAVLYQIAQVLLNAGNFKNGKIYAKRAYELDKQNIWYSTLLANIYFEENKLDSAIYIYEKTAEIFPNDEQLQIFLANIYSENGDYEKSIEIHQILRQKYGINENMTPAYIKNLILADRFDLAFEETQEAIKLFPDEVIFYALLAEIYGRKGDKIKAAEVYQKIMEDNPQNPQILISVCDFLLNEELYDELFQTVNSAIINPEIRKEEKISLFSRILETPNLTNEFIEQTVLSLMILEAFYENDEIVVLLRPELFDKNNRKTDAIKRLEEVVSYHSDNHFAWEKLLLLYLETKNFNMLMTRGEEYASKFNRSIFGKLLYAHGALENERYDIALDELRKATILAGDNKEAIIQILTMKSEVFYRMNNLTEAFKTFEEALEIAPNDMTTLNNYAYYLAEHDMELKKAEAMSRKVIEQEKDNATFLDTYAWVLFKMGKTKDAAKIMEQIISQGTNLSAEHYEHYGFILKKLKRCNEAIENWEIAIKLDSTKNQLNNEIENCKR